MENVLASISLGIDIFPQVLQTRRNWNYYSRRKREKYYIYWSYNYVSCHRKKTPIKLTSANDLPAVGKKKEIGRNWIIASEMW